MNAPENPPNTFLKDLSLFVGHNKILVIALVFIFSWGRPLLGVWRTHMLSSDHNIFYQDESLQVVQGEKFDEINSSYTVKGHEKEFNQKHLSIHTKEIPKENYIFVKYQFSVAEEGVHKIFVAGSPPGSQETGADIYFSSYDVIVDGRTPLPFYEEKKIRTLLDEISSDFYMYYEYAPVMHFTKIGEFELKEGTHQVEFRIHKSRVVDQDRVFYLDAFFVVPKDWKPKKEWFSFPADLFSY